MRTANFKPMNPEAAKQICSWRYEQPYSVYNYITYEEAVKKQAAITQPENADNYLCFWNDENLIAYTSIILKDEKVYIGIGVSPQFCGQGSGNYYLNKTLFEAKKRYPLNEIWVQVRSWNERAIKCYRKSGFVEKHREIIYDRFNDKTEFVFMRFYKMMISFSYLNKSDFSTISNDLFNILADNMEKIAPTGNTREDDYKCWYQGVSDGLNRNKRQIILIKDNENIIGFFQYYTNDDTFMMEEIQFKPEYKGKGVFRALYSFIIPHINEDIEFVEAYASIDNDKSIGILENFGMTNIGLNKNGRSCHFKGTYADLLKWYHSGSNL